jgi:hypothetical protein
MAVRRAMGKDVDQVLDLFREMYRRSRYAEFTLDERYVKQMLLQIAMANPHRAADAAMQCFIAESDTARDLHGFIMPACDRIYHVGAELMVSDLFFYVREGAPARTAAALWRQLTRRGYRVRGITLEKIVAAVAARSAAA